MIAFSVIIPFRDRGTDPLRKQNLDRVLRHWWNADQAPMVVADGGKGNSQFNRSKAYNIGVNMTAADVLVFAESDIIVPHDQMNNAIHAAYDYPGLVIPFTDYYALTPQASEWVRNGEMEPQYAATDMWITGGGSFGAVNVMSRETYERVGQFDEAFCGSWYDDTAMKRAFELTSGPLRYVNGPAYHLYHLPGWSGDHLTDEDKAATERNKRRYEAYMAAQTTDQILHLTAGN